MTHRMRWVCFLMFNCSFLSAQESENIGNLKIVVSGLKNDQGDVKIGLFNSAGSFQGKSDKFRGSILSITDKRAEWLIENIPFGEYAVKLFHDEDKDDRIDRNFMGMPSESIGFSNNAKIGWGPPGFKKAKFLFHSKEMILVIDLNQ
jgi:uncharacterized protein (DUF2141 family)